MTDQVTIMVQEMTKEEISQVEDHTVEMDIEMRSTDRAEDQTVDLQFLQMIWEQELIVEKTEMIDLGQA